MKIKVGMLLLFTISLLFISIMGPNNEIHAKVCPPGQFPKNEIFVPFGDGDNPSKNMIVMKCKNPVNETTDEKSADFDNSKRQINKYGEYLYIFLKVLQLSSTTIAIFLVVLAGNAYIFAQGQQQGIERAKNMLTLAFVGFFMMATSFVIMRIMTEVIGVTQIGAVQF